MTWNSSEKPLDRLNTVRTDLGVQSNPVNSDTEGVTESVLAKRVEFRGNVSTFFTRRKGKISVTIRCPY